MGFNGFPPGRAADMPSYARKLTGVLSSGFPGGESLRLAGLVQRRFRTVPRKFLADRRGWRQLVKKQPLNRDSEIMDARCQMTLPSCQASHGRPGPPTPRRDRRRRTQGSLPGCQAGPAGGSHARRPAGFTESVCGLKVNFWPHPLSDHDHPTNVT
eukprot:765824-Hanusia_phi.AAC.3